MRTVGVAVQQSRPSARTWLLTALELIAALTAARLIVWADRAPVTGHDEHGMAEMPGTPESVAAAIPWSWVEYASLSVAVVALGWWLLRRQATAAIVAAGAVAVFAASPAVRGLASHSHLVAMVALELLIVACPLLILTAWPRLSDSPPARRWAGGWTIFAVAGALLYAALLIVIHIPAVHRRGAEAGSVPPWVALVVLAIGLAYWFSVIRTADRVPTKTRRSLLIGAQEIAAFIGLLSLFGAWAVMTHTMPLGISAAWDQRLGGLFMMATCAAVAVPLLRTIR
jgi:hypothetical protein